MIIVFIVSFVAPVVVGTSQRRVLACAPALLLVCLTAACSSDTRPAPVQRAADIAIDYCLDAIARDAAPDPARCPAFLLEPLRSARFTCEDVGGRLIAADEPDVWTLDVNGDARPEFLLTDDSIVACENAWSVFSCGSLGCPRTLYAEREGAWETIAAVYADSRESIEVLDRARGDGYRDLRVTRGPEDNGERWLYVWQNGGYDRTSLEVRGVTVEFAASVHGLYPLVDETAILARPGAPAEMIARYPAGTDVAIVGTTPDGGHFYVSPCNACTNGFVPVSAVRVR